MSLTDVTSYFQNIQTEHGWVFQVFAVVLATLALNLVSNIFFGYLLKQLSKTDNPWDDALVMAISKPMGFLIWLVGLTFAITLIDGAEESAIFSAIDPFRDVGVIVIISWFLIRFIRSVEENLSVEKPGKEPIDKTTLDAIAKLLRASVLITMALVILQTLGYSISGVLAFGGIGGLAVGLASKDLLANFFGGFMLYLDRPFVIGDWVRSPDKNIEGVVEHIGWRLTRIRTFDKRPLYVPNSTFTTISVENPSRMQNRRIYEVIGLRYGDIQHLPKIVEDVTQMLKQHPDIDQNQTMIVNFNAFAASSIDFFVYTFTKTTVWTRFHEVKQDVLLKIADIIEREGAEIAFPTSTIHLANNDEPTDGLKVSTRV